MRDFEPLSLCHNQMATSFEMLSVTITEPAHGFLHTLKNLSPFTIDFHGEGQLKANLASSKETYSIYDILELLQTAVMK